MGVVGLTYLIKLVGPKVFYISYFDHCPVTTVQPLVVLFLTDSLNTVNRA